MDCPKSNQLSFYQLDPDLTSFVGCPTASAEHHFDFIDTAAAVVAVAVTSFLFTVSQKCSSSFASPRERARERNQRYSCPVCSLPLHGREAKKFNLWRNICSSSTRQGLTRLRTSCGINAAARTAESSAPRACLSTRLTSTGSSEESEDRHSRSYESSNCSGRSTRS